MHLWERSCFLVTNTASVLNGNMMSDLQKISCNHEMTGRKEWLMRTMEMPSQSPIPVWSQQLGLLWEGISHLLSRHNLGFQLLAAKSITDSISHPCLYSKTSPLIQHDCCHMWRRQRQPHSSVLAGRIPGTGEPGGCRLWGRTDSHTTEATRRQQLSYEVLK